MTLIVWCIYYDIISLVYLLWHHCFMCIYYDITVIGVCTMTSLFVVLTGRSLLNWSTGSRAAPPLTFTPSRAVYISSAPSPRVSFILHSYCPSCAQSNYRSRITPLCWGMLGRILCLRSCVHSKSCVNGELGVQCTWKFVATRRDLKQMLDVWKQWKQPYLCK